MKTICIDWGNSRVKVGIFNETGFLESNYNFAHDEAVKSIAGLITEKNIDGGILSTVANVPQIFADFFREEKGFMLLDHNTATPLINAYQTPETLGADRIAGAVAAHAAHPEADNLVINVGTCLVFSLVTKNRIFRGGAIAPGVDMRLKSVHQFTDRLPLVSRDGLNTLVGYDTDSSIRSGAINGVLYEIEGTIQAYQSQFPDINVTITGGDASLFAMKLKSKIFADPHLILKGLYLIYQYNAK